MLTQGMLIGKLRIFYYYMDIYFCVLFVGLLKKYYYYLRSIDFDDNGFYMK